MNKEYTYKENEEVFKKYTDECRKKIENLVFNEEEIKQGELLKKELLSKGLVTKDISISDAIKVKRNDLIRIKIDHTMRNVSDVAAIAQKVGTNFDFEKIVKVAALLHDIGRFDQAIYANDYNDKTNKMFNPDPSNKKIMYHGEYGYNKLLNNDFEGFNVPEEYKYAVLQAILHHQDNILPNELSKKFITANELDVNLLSGSKPLSEAEEIVVSSIVQMVKDVDMIDILYQNSTGEFNVMISNMTKNVNGKKLSDFSVEYGISEKDLIEINSLDNDDISSLKKIVIPVNKITNIKALEVPKDIQEKFFNKENLELKELNSREDWSFITGMWWRLNQFLLKINFVSNLEIIEEKNLLDLIYSQYPDNFKPLVYPAFEFAKEELLEKTIKNNEGNIYVQR